MNKELIVIQDWFNANKLSLNATKTKYSFFYSLFSVDKIPLRLPELIISNTVLGVLLDENITWRPHIKCIESRISKNLGNLGILYKARYFF